MVDDGYLIGYEDTNGDFVEVGRFNNQAEDTNQPVEIVHTGSGEKVELGPGGFNANNITANSVNTDGVDYNALTPDYRLQTFNLPIESSNQTTTSTDYTTLFELGGVVDVGDIPLNTSLYGRLIIANINDTSSETTFARPTVLGGGGALPELEVSRTSTSFGIADSGWTEITTALSGNQRAWAIEGKVSGGTGEYFNNNLSLQLAGVESVE